MRPLLPRSPALEALSKPVSASGITQPSQHAAHYSNSSHHTHTSFWFGLAFISSSEFFLFLLKISPTNFRQINKITKNNYYIKATQTLQRGLAGHLRCFLPQTPLFALFPAPTLPSLCIHGLVHVPLPSGSRTLVS